MQLSSITPRDDAFYQQYGMDSSFMNDSILNDSQFGVNKNRPMQRGVVSPTMMSMNTNRSNSSGSISRRKRSPDDGIFHTNMPNSNLTLEM